MVDVAPVEVALGRSGFHMATWGSSVVELVLYGVAAGGEGFVCGGLLHASGSGEESGRRMYCMYVLLWRYTIPCGRRSRLPGISRHIPPHMAFVVRYST